MIDAVVARIDQVTHRYGRTFALNDLTLDIPAQRMVGMIGPDGVGKSTLLGLISGVRKIQTGKVTVLDGDMADGAHRRASYGRIAYMPQGLGRNLYPTLIPPRDPDADMCARTARGAEHERLHGPPGSVHRSVAHAVVFRRSVRLA